jgi:G:T-mismatch repair DNA endonuclease (very short patch repair protein)
MNVKLEFEKIDLNKEILSLNSNNVSRKAYVRSVVTDDLLSYLYFEENMSANKINEYLNCRGVRFGGAGTIIKRLKEIGKYTRSWSEAANLNTVRDQQRKTLRDRYGSEVVNISQIESVKKKKADKCLAKYGVDNNFKSKEIKSRIKEYWRANYGVEGYFELNLTKRFRLTKPHKLVLSMLADVGIECEAETNKYFKAYNPVMVRRFCPVVDIYIPQKRLVIEINGVYWHAKPGIYKPNDVFNTVYGKLTASQIWMRDKIKEDHIKSLGFNFEVIWSDEIDKERIDSIINKYEDCKN